MVAGLLEIHTWSQKKIRATNIFFSMEKNVFQKHDIFKKSIFERKNMDFYLEFSFKINIFRFVFKKMSFLKIFFLHDEIICFVRIFFCDQVCICTNPRNHLEQPRNLLASLRRLSWAGIQIQERSRNLTCDPYPRDSKCPFYYVFEWILTQIL